MDNLRNIPIAHSLSSCDLNTNFNDKCHVDWSWSNLISVVTLDGIYILKPQLDIPHGPFNIELIRNPTKRFRHHPISERWPAFDSIWSTLDIEQYMEVYLDPALMTNIDKLSTDLYPRRFRLAKWSPVIETFPKQCLLAAVTVDYQLIIYSRIFDSWIVLTDLSSDYDKLWSQLHKNSSPKEGANFLGVQNDLHSLSFCHICWRETEQNGLLLLAATIPGDIVIWQVTRRSVSGDTGDELLNGPTGIRLVIMKIIRTSLDYISSMHMFKNLLIVSARDGQVVLFDLTTDLDKIKIATFPVEKQDICDSQSLEKLNPTPISVTATIWHSDDIEVTDFYLQPISQESFRIVLAKSTKICWCTINYTLNSDTGSATLTISDTFSAIDGLDPDSTLFQTPATCLKSAGARKAVLIADDGSFFQLEFLDNREDSSPEFNAVSTGRVDLNRMVPRGLCTSPQGNSIVMISCISLIHDSSKILAPAKLVLLPLINDRLYFIDCFYKLLDEKWLRKEKITSPMDVFDRIDYLRSTSTTLTAVHSYEIFKILRKETLDLAAPVDDTQFVKLKISAFLLLKLQQNSRSKRIGDQHDELEEKIYSSILLCNIKRVLSLVAAKYLEEKVFTVDQVKSLRNIFTWLNLSPEGINLSADYDKISALLKTHYSNSPHEICSICHSDIAFVSVYQGTCTNGHRFNRCARSLLILDLQTTCGELICEHCGRSYLSRLLWPTTDLWLCSFCQ